MSCYCPTCEDFVQPAEGGEAMSRIELYRRTKGYSIFGVVNAKMFSAAVILVVIALGLKNPQLILDSDILCVSALCGAVALFWILRYWKHWLDIFKKDYVIQFLLLSAIYTLDLYLIVSKVADIAFNMVFFQAIWLKLALVSLTACGISIISYHLDHGLGTLVNRHSR